MDPESLLRDVFGFPGFRPGQKRVMSALWRHKAALAVFPTDGGKSLCYQLPALMFEGVTLVVSPLIALMKDQIDFLRARDVQAARIDSSLSVEELRDVAGRLREGTLKLLYVAPERFNNERFVAMLREVRIALFAVDEAHCISEWGHNFRPDYLKLAETARTLGAGRVLALTATATPDVVRDICAGFGIPDDAAVVTGSYRSNLTLLTTPVAEHERDALLLARLLERPPGPTIVYVTLQRTAERVAELLTEAGLPAEAYHAGMDTERRTAVQERWMASERGIVVATIAFGMGIDKADVRYVYHFNLPRSLEAYSQETGRAGRDGQPSNVELLACPDDVPVLDNFAYGDTPTEGALHGVVKELLGVEEGESGRGGELALSLSELASRHDLRSLVLSTALTYLELAGVLKQGTPFYGAYELKPLAPLDEIIGGFTGVSASIVRGIFEQAKRGRVWYTLDPGEVAAALGFEREKLVRAIEYLGDNGLAEVRVADVRHRYSVLKPDADPDELARELAERFHRREAQEIARTRQVLELVQLDACQWNALAAHFGEERAKPCGHCTWCLTGRAQALPARRPLPPIPSQIDAAELRDLRAANQEALSEPRQLARFLCGLSSPALTRAKLSRHTLYGALDRYPFADILAWCSGVR